MAKRPLVFVLKNMSSHLITGSIIVDIVRYIVIRIDKETIPSHESSHAFENKIYFFGPMKALFARLTVKLNKDMCTLRLHLLVVIDSIKYHTQL